MNTKTFAYLRCSGLSQCGEDKGGFPRQSDATKSFANKHGYEIVREFKEEGISGRKDETQRPAFMDMVASIMENGVRHVLVESLQRLAREYRIQEQLLIYLASKDIQLIACDTGENITEAMNGDPMRKALVQIQGIFHELDRAVLIRKLAAGKKRKRDRGERCDGKKPFGFRPGEGDTLSLMKSMRGEGRTMRDIATHLNDVAAPTRIAGSRWHVGQVGRILARSKSISTSL